MICLIYSTEICPFQLDKKLHANVSSFNLYTINEEKEIEFNNALKGKFMVSLVDYNFICITLNVKPEYNYVVNCYLAVKTLTKEVNFTQ